MIKKYLILLLVLFFLNVVSFTQEEIIIVEQQNTDIAQMREVVNKLKSGMTREEVENLIGKPLFETNDGSIYWFSSSERLTLYYTSTLYSAYNKNNFDFFGISYTANSTGPFVLPIYLNDKEFLPISSVISVRGDTYLPIEKLGSLLGFTVSFKIEKQQQKATPKNYNGDYGVPAVDFPIFLNGNELLTSNPIVNVNGVIYISINDFAKLLGLPVTFNSERQSIDIGKSSSNIGLSMLTPGACAAIVTTKQVFVDGNKLLTIDPIVTVDDKIYLPLEEVNNELNIKLDFKRELQTFKINNIDYPLYVRKSLDIITDMEVNNNIELKDNEGVAQFQADISKLRKGMTKDEVRLILGEPQPEDIHVPPLSRVSPYLHYLHDGGGLVKILYDDGKLSAVFNKSNIDLLSTGYIATIANFIVLIDGKELLTSNSVVTISNKVYVPIEDLAEQLGMKAFFDEEMQQLEITTK